MKESTHIDKTDRDLISLLRKDGRAPLSRIAKTLGIARGTVQNRLDRLVNSGAIVGFSVRVRDDFGLDAVRAIMMVEVGGKATAQVIAALRGMPEVQTLHSTNGTWDLLAEVQCPSLAEFDRVLREVRMIDGVVNSETNLLLSTL